MKITKVSAQDIGGFCFLWLILAFVFGTNQIIQADSNQKVYNQNITQQVITYQIKRGETLCKISRRYFVSVEALARLNHIANPNLIESGRVIYIPRVETARNSLMKSDFKLLMPVKGRLSSRYGYRWGRMHRGIDLAASEGTPVRAAATGKVVYAGWFGSYGKLIKLNHGCLGTKYGHLSKIFVRPGMRVAVGQVIGLVGSTGRSTGNHLHFEVEQYGRKINPSRFL